MTKTAPTTDNKKQKKIMAVCALVIVVVSAAIGILFTISLGIFLGILGLAALAVGSILKNPPPSKGRNGADRIGFGN